MKLNTWSKIYSYILLIFKLHIERFKYLNQFL